MAKGKAGKQSNRLKGKVFIIGAVLIAIVLAVIWFYRAPIEGYAAAGTAYSARVACSCRFVAGRALEDCEKDKLAGMGLVRLSENVEERSVTASFPLIYSDTAEYREGYGCVLRSWRG
ncbi:hypothetical protein GRI38_12105 [Altererythrobacter aurantiacus]|uniref:Uncharacterized protein n=1 Tax=Parapontixanthobacter aurantiacus TaxID=1463599 RepID=A0A844ZG82_9SPHN|nr:hypothetical protein [Parapontixanthobacter aurantiacus]MXO86768.1 hypothetical protein [Parapontixanthobacter aurantiacus]